MNRLFNLILISAIMFFGGTINATNSRDNINEKVEKLIAQMTLEEKFGQMSQVNGAYGQIPVYLKDGIKNGRIGSILNEVDVETLNEIQRIAIEESRLGIPLLIGRDVIHGFKTVFPIPLGLAATWNPELIEEGAQIAALEAASSGINWTFAPMIDVSRDARWGRIAESFGEDPLLISKYGEAMVKGFQHNGKFKDGGIAACAKHFCGYGAAEGGRDYNTTLIPERELRDIYFPPFKAAVDAGVKTFMTGFNDLNGVPASGNRFLFRQVLRDEWNFNGMVVSDWASIHEMIEHGFVANDKEAANKAILAGVDMEMASTSYMKYGQKLLEENTINIEMVDQAVRNILKLKFELGLFENPYVEREEQYQFAKPEYLESAKKAALQSMVLLKNENSTLPLSKDIKKVAVIGPMANQAYEQLGTWNFDGDSTLSVTPLKGLKNALGESKVLHAPGMKISRTKEHDGFEAAVEVAMQSDVVILCLGEEAIITGEAHSRADIGLPGAQDELVKELAETGKPIIMVVLAGRPLAIGEISEYADAVLYAWHFGSMGGEALAELVFGDVSPSGKLPVTFPKSSGQIPFYYNRKNSGRPVIPEEWVSMDDIPVKAVQTSLGNTSHYIDLGYAPLYPFGYGLSYSSFEYSELTMKTPEVELGESIIATVTLKNTGKYIADEVVQLYVHDLVGDVTRPIKELKDFKRVTLNPGESKTIQFELQTDELGFYNQEMKKVTEPGKFDLWIGGNSEAELKTTFTIK